MNKKLLLKVKAKILERPEEFDMAHWHHPCKTAHCIGGYAQIIQRGHCDAFYCDQEATEDLGLNNAQADRLFQTDCWPKKFSYAYKRAVTAGDWTKSAQIAADRIDHFIATEGQE